MDHKLREKLTRRSEAIHRVLDPNSRNSVSWENVDASRAFLIDTSTLPSRRRGEAVTSRATRLSFTRPPPRGRFQVHQDFWLSLAHLQGHLVT